MLSSVYQIFEDTVQRAENWLRSINAISSSIPIIKSLQTTNNEQNNNEQQQDQELYNLLLAPIRNLQISS